MQETQEIQVQSLGWEDSLEWGMGTQLQYSSLGNPMDREARWAKVHRVTEELDVTKQLKTPTACGNRKLKPTGQVWFI